MGRIVAIGGGLAEKEISDLIFSADIIFVGGETVKTRIDAENIQEQNGEII